MSDNNKIYPLISIIMPVYNAEKYVKKAVESVIKQSYTHFELIIVDDGSTDRSAYICEELAKNDSRIRVIHKKNSGVSSARNTGIQYSLGKYITFIDDDDEYDEKYCEILLNSIEKHNADIIKCGRKNITIKIDGSITRTIDRFYPKSCFVNIDSFWEDYYEFKKYDFIGSVWNGLYRADIIKQYNIIFDENVLHGNEDIIFNYSYLRNCKNIVIQSDVLYYHYYRLSHSTSMKFHGDQISNRIRSIIDEAELVKKYPEQLNLVYLDGIRSCFCLLIATNNKEIRNKYIKIIERELKNCKVERPKYLYDKKLSITFKIEIFLIYHKLYWVYFGLRRMRMMIINKII